MFWNAQLILIVVAILAVDQSVQLSLFVAYSALMVLVLVAKIKREKDALDQTTQLRTRAPIIPYLNSVMQPRLPIRYTRAYSDYSPSPKMLKDLFNLLIEAKPKNVLELGSGLTTLIASYALKQNRYGKVVSWDCIENRAAGNRELINLHGQGKYVEILDVTTSKSIQKDGTKSWFDQKPEDKIDFLVVDDSVEPPVVPRGKDVMEELMPYLEIGCTILLHDRIRPVENETLSHWLSSKNDLLLIQRVQTNKNTYSVLRLGPGVNLVERS